MSLVIQREVSDTSNDDAPAAKEQKVAPPLRWSTLPYKPTYFRPNGSKYVPLTYAEKLESPVITIAVGGSSRIFRVHKAMLTEAAEFFEVMLDGSFREGIENRVEFPEDDVESWEELSRWCYTGDLEPLADPNTRSTSQKANPMDCWTRLRLCCLAEKYDMKLLQNFAMDSIIGYLQACGEGPAIDFEMFSVWTKYVYHSTHEMSALRKFISTYFYYALMYSEQWPVARDPELTSTQYGVDELYSLAENNPDLQRQIFSHVRQFNPLMQHTSTDLGPEPWTASPCKFHNHTDPSIKRTGLECPESLHHFVQRWPEISARVQYFVQDRTLKGADILYVQQVATELRIELRDVNSSMAGLVRTEMIAWVVPKISFRVAPPRASR